MVESIKELRKKCSSKSLIDDWFTEKISRNISIYFTKLWLLLGMSANQVTTFIVIFGILSSILLFTGNLYLMLIGILALIFNFILDASDGEVARYNKTKSLLGGHIDQIQHHLLPRLYFFGIGFSVFLNTEMLSVLIFGLLCVIFSVSIVMDTLCWELVRVGLEDIQRKKRWNINSTKIIKQIGETKYKLVLTSPFRCPYDKVFLLFFILIEIINLRLMLFKPFMLLYLVIAFYGICFFLMQFISFIMHYKSKSIESYYQTLYIKKK